MHTQGCLACGYTEKACTHTECRCILLSGARHKHIVSGDARTWQVKARMRECQLHRDSPLGDALLECYACGSRNAFALGFVPVRARPCMLGRVYASFVLAIT